MQDIVSKSFSKFFNERNKPLTEKFPGHYRAIVVETNDPLNMGRVKFKCPEMHDSDIKSQDCPWAVPSPDLGGAKAGRYTHPCIGDIIWITFEKQHPYGPIWTGFASPTRRGMYPTQFVHTESPPMLNNNGSLVPGAADYLEEYLPKDRRPMSQGWVDRYGNADISSSVGYYPVAHDTPPPPQGHDPLQNKSFKGSTSKPLVNDPDKKYIARITKYGNMLIMGDQGYYWKKNPQSSDSVGEFTGDHDVDIEWEKKRWVYLQKQLNENEPSSSTKGAKPGKKNGDQRRIELTTRYGHKIECRDVGWAQLGPIKSMSRQGEYDKPALLSLENKNDYRWIKIRTKGGMLFQCYDKGFNPDTDKFIKRKLIEEQGPATEQEDKHWGKKDARWIRLVTRYGYKIVLDDRGSDDSNADKRDFPRGNGILIKGRRSPGVKKDEARGNPRGFYWEFNENDEANHTTWGTPMGMAIEMNDRYQYTLLAASMGRGWSTKWLGIKENEFLGKPLMINDPEKKSHHLKLDHDNEYIRLKTRGGKGTKPKRPSNPSNVGAGEINQGFEARDGVKGDGPWVELVDSQRRGFWFSKRYRIGIWRSSREKRMYMWMDEVRKRIAIYNSDADGKIVIFCNSDVDVIAQRNIRMTAGNNITMNAGNTIRMQAGGTLMTLSSNILMNRPVLPGGMQAPRLQKPEKPERIEPTDRGATYNQPFEKCSKQEIEHKS